MIERNNLTQGAKFDGEKPMVDLLDPDAMLEHARVLTYGAKKYTKYGECTCDFAKNVKNVQSTLAGSAEVVMTNSFEKTIQNTGHDKTQMPNVGRHNIQNASPHTKQRDEEKKPQTLGLRGEGRTSGCGADMGLNQQLGENCLQAAALSVGATKDCALTMTTKPTRSADAYVTPVTSAWVSSNAQTVGSKEHSSTCAARQVVIEGRNNWRKGINFTRILGAILRHTWAIARGEDKDPETGLLHAAHVMCEAMFLCSYQSHPELYAKFDDRWKPPA